MGGVRFLLLAMIRTLAIILVLAAFCDGHKKRQLLGGLPVLSSLDLGSLNLGGVLSGGGQGGPTSGGLPLIQTLTGLLQEDTAYQHYQGINRSRTPEDLHSNLHSLTPAGNKQSFQSTAITKALKAFRNESKDDDIPSNVKETLFKLFCKVDDVCTKQAIYRSADGSCNNLEHPRWGRSESPMMRVLPPQYADGVEVPRLSVTGSDLPSARKVSSAIAIFRNRPDDHLNLAFMQFGQFLIHDTDLIPVSRKEDGSHVNCCSQDGHHIPPELLDPSCFPIDIERDDPFYSMFNQTCMNFVRSARAITDDCSFRHADQMNQVTDYLDCSMVYGSSKKMADNVREFHHGLLKVNRQANHEMLPNSPLCSNDVQSKCRFITGDIRANQHPWLQSYHLLLVREHNRVARELHRINRHWSDEKLYQETRRIIIAQFQHIVYKEWLPLVLGHKYVSDHLLQPPEKGYCRTYNHNVNPSISNEFATFACRFGHTLIDTRIRLLDEEGHTVKHHLLREQFNNVAIMHQPELFDQILRGLYLRKCQKLDDFFTWEVTRYTYKTDLSNAGFDLVALNMQRGRDHGLPGYIKYRELCGLQPVRNFHQLRAFMTPETAIKFSQLYNSVEDIDPFIGAISEFPAKGAVVGPTMQCIIADQFHRLWHGDSFFYCERNSRNPFTSEQLSEIQKTTMSRIICNAGDNISRIQARAFELPSLSNPILSCENIPQLDVNLWRDS